MGSALLCRLPNALKLFETGVVMSRTTRTGVFEVTNLQAYILLARLPASAFGSFGYVMESAVYTIKTK